MIILGGVFICAVLAPLVYTEIIQACFNYQCFYSSIKLFR
jgi:hypothetical protein